MRSPGEIWRLRLWVWVPALLFFLANATAYTPAANLVTMAAPALPPADRGLPRDDM